MSPSRTSGSNHLPQGPFFYGVPIAVGLGTPEYGESVGYSDGVRHVSEAVVKYVHPDHRLIIRSLPWWSHWDPGISRDWLQHFPPIAETQKRDAAATVFREESQRIRIAGVEATLDSVHYGSSWVGTAELPTASIRLVIHSVNVARSLASVLIQLEPPTAPVPNAGPTDPRQR